VLRCVAMCCSVMQCVAVCYSVLQCVAEWKAFKSAQNALFACLNTYMRMCVYSCTHTHAHMHPYIHAYTITYNHTQPPTNTRILTISICMYAHTFTPNKPHYYCNYNNTLHTHTLIYMYILIYTHVYIYMYTYIHTYIYIYV